MQLRRMPQLAYCTNCAQVSLQAGARAEFAGTSDRNAVMVARLDLSVANASVALTDAAPTRSSRNRAMRTLITVGLCVAITGVASSAMQSDSPSAPSASRPQISITVPEHVSAGSAVRTEVTIEGAASVAAAQYSIGFDDASLAFDGADAPPRTSAGVAQGLNVVEHGDAVTTGFVTPKPSDSNAVTRLVGHVVFAPRSEGQFELKLANVVLADAKGKRLTVDVRGSAKVRVGSSKQRHDAPAVPTSRTPGEKPAAPSNVLLGEAQADWTLATEAGGCSEANCTDVADVQRSSSTTFSVPSAPSATPPSSYTYVVDSASDSVDASIGDGNCLTSGGVCTLRAAMQEANTRVVPVAINFNIPGGGVKTIAPATRLPILTNVTAPITIDGFTQAGASANTDPLESNAVYTIEITGTGPGGIDGFFLAGANVTLRGLNIHSFGRTLWMLGAASTNNSVVGSLLGLLPDGSSDPLVVLAIGKSCVVIQGGAHHNTIGQPGDANRNVISGCPHQNIATYDNGTDYNVIQNNIVGLDPTGTKRRGAKSHGIDLNTWTSHTLVGGTGAGERNVLSGNLGNGIEISHGIGTMFNEIVGNFVGTTLDGNSVVAATMNNAVGVRLEGNPFCPTTCDPDISYQSVIGNVIANSGGGGIYIDKGTHHSTIQDNKIGVTANGGDGGNDIFGIRIEAGVYNTLIQGNEIANNDNGIQILSTGANPPNPTPSPTNFNTITQNSIHDNGIGGTLALGIDFPPLGSVNTSGNADPFVNEAIIGPVLSNARAAAVDAQTCGSCTVELFLADRGSTFSGSGTTFLVSKVADTNGFVQLYLPAIAHGQVVTATTTNPAGSTSEFGRNITIPNPSAGNAAPVASFTTTCSQLTCSFNAGGSSDTDGSIVRYEWQFGDGTSLEGATAVHSYATGGTFDVTLVVTDNDAATGTVTNPATSVNLAPTASFTGTCAFQLCALDASASTDPDGPIATYAWDFGDGTTGTGVTTTRTFANSGTFVVTLTVDDGNGANNSASQSFTVTALPNGTLAYDSFSRTLTNSLGNAEFGGAYTQSGSSSDYSVSGGLGRIRTTTANSSRTATLVSTAARDTDTYVDIATDKTPTGGSWGQVGGPMARRQSGNLEYRLRLRFPVGGGVKLSIVKVVNSTTEVLIGSEVNVAGATYSPAQMIRTRFRVTGVNPTSLQAKAWPVASAEPSTWGINVSDTQTELQTTGIAGVRTYLGGSSSNTPVTWSFDNLQVTVINTAPTASFTSSCVNSVCSFNASGSFDPDGTINSYSWNFGDGTTGTGVTPTHDYGSDFGAHTVVLTVADNFSAIGVDSQSINVVNLPPTAAFAVNCVDLTCSFNATTSTDADGTLTSYVWDFGDGYGGTGSTISHTYAAGDVYTFVLSVTDDDGASDAASQTLTVLAPNVLPTASFTYSCVLLDCDFDGSTSTDSDGVITEYAWDFDDGGSATGIAPTNTFPYTGTFNVVFTVTDDRGGIDTETIAVSVTGPNVAPTANLATNCTLLTCTFNATGSTDPDGVIQSYLVDFGDGTSVSTATSSHTYAIAGTWPVTLTVTDDDGATDTVSTYVVVAPATPISIFAQDTFTRTTTNAWGTADLGGTWTVSGTASNYATTGTTGTQRITAVGGSTIAYLPGVSNTDQEVNVTVAADKSPSGNGHWATVVVRKVSTNNEYRIRIRMSSTGIGLGVLRLANSASSTLVGAEFATGITYTPNAAYRVRAQVLGTNPTTIRAKVWLASGTEPTTWQIVRTDTTATIQGGGSTGLTAYNVATVAPIVFTFDNYSIVPANAAPVASFTSNCVGMTCSFDASASTDDTSIASYQWSFGDGATATGVTPSRTYSSSGMYTATLTVTDGQGVTNVTTRTVAINQAPTAAFTQSCTSHDCAFDSSGSSDTDGSIVSYAWTFGDGSTSTAVSPSHTYVAAGTYSVTLTVTDNSGATGSVTQSVQVNDPPTAAFGTACTLYDCDFDGSGSSDPDGTISDYEWDFGDGTSGTTVTPSHQYATAGSYNVTLTVTDDLGATASVSLVVVANAAPTASFIGDCTLLTCDFDASASSDTDGTIDAYAWTFGDGGTATGSTPSHTFAPGGPYTVTLTVADDLGASAQDTQSVAVNAAPTASFVSTCSDYSCTFDAASSSDPEGPIASYDWDFGDGSTASGVTASHAYVAPGEYTVTLTIADSENVTDMVSHTATANYAPAAAFSATCTLLSCAFDAAASTDGDGTIVSYSWDFGDGQTATGIAPSHVYTAGGPYLVQLTVVDDLGAPAMTTQTVNTNAPPTAAFTANCTLLTCSLDAASSTDPDGTIADFAWTFGDATTGTGVTQSHTFTLAGTYPITLTVTDDDGATATTTQLIVVSPTPAVTQLATDAFGRTVSNAWGTADSGGAWTATGTASNFAVNSGVGKISSTVTATSNQARLAGVSSTELDVSTRISFDKAQSGTGSWVNLVGRYVGSNLEYRGRVRFGGASVLAGAYRLNGGAAQIIGSEVTIPGVTSAPNTWYRARMNVSGTNPTTIRIKVWLDGTTEPSTWNVTQTDTSAALQVAGSPGLHSYSQGTMPLTISIDDYSVRPANLPPVAAFTANCTGSAQCSFNAGTSSDDGSIVSYEWVHGDGTMATGVTDTHTFAAPGNYTVTLTVTDNLGVKTFVAQTVAVT